MVKSYDERSHGRAASVLSDMSGIDSANGNDSLEEQDSDAEYVVGKHFFAIVYPLVAYTFLVRCRGYSGCTSS